MARIRIAVAARGMVGVGARGLRGNGDQVANTSKRLFMDVGAICIPEKKDIWTR